MANTRKEQEREELHKTIWGIADDLRGSVDGFELYKIIYTVQKQMCVI